MITISKNQYKDFQYFSTLANCVKKGKVPSVYSFVYKSGKDWVASDARTLSKYECEMYEEAPDGFYKVIKATKSEIILVHDEEAQSSYNFPDYNRVIPTDDKVENWYETCINHKDVFKTKENVSKIIYNLAQDKVAVNYDYIEKKIKNISFELKYGSTGSMSPIIFKSEIDNFVFVCMPFMIKND